MTKTFVSSDQAQGWGFVKGMGWVWLSTVKGDPGGDLCTMDRYCVRRSQVTGFQPFPSPEEIWGMLGTTPDEYWTMRLDACPDPTYYPAY